MLKARMTMEPPSRWIPEQKVANRIALGYAAVGSLWILCSGSLLHALVTNGEWEAFLEQIKGWFFVLVTAGLLWLALTRYFREIRRSARLIQESERRWHFALEGAGQGVWDWNVQTNEVFYNDQWRTIIGYEPDEIANSLEEWRRRVHSDDLSRVMMHIQEHLDGKTPLYQSEHRIQCKNGNYKWILEQGKVMSRTPEGRPLRFLGTYFDITARKQAERLQMLSAKIMDILNDHRDLLHATQRILEAIKCETEFEAVGIRLKNGEDFPYSASEGFSHSFIHSENSLAARTPEGEFCRDEKGNLRLECTCGLILTGQIDPTNPLFTPGGSAWTNHAKSFLHVPASQDPRLNPRNRCIHEGFQSVALIPIRVENEIVGLLQLNDRRRDCFTLESIRFFEGIASSFGVALARQREEQMLRKWADAFEHCAHGISIGIPETNRILICNPALARMAGRPVEEISNRPILSLYSPEDHAHVMERIAVADRAGQVQYEARMIRKDGGSFPAQVDVVSVRDGGGLARYRVATVQDITERKRAGEALRESEARYRLVSENSSDVIWLFDLAANRFVYVSPSVQRLRGFNVAEVLKQTMEEALTPESYRLVADKLPARLEAFAAGDESQRIQIHEVTQICKNGSTVPTEVVTTLVADAQKRVTHIQGVSRDITERKRLEEQLRQAQKLEAIGQLAGGVAHDFNNILAAIMMNLSLIKMLPGIDPPMKQALNDLDGEVKRAATLTRQLLMFSRRSALAVKPLDLNEVIANLLKMLIRLIGEHIKLRFDGESTLPLVEADAGMLEQVLMNLVVNARDAMPKGGRITIATRLADVDAAFATENSARHPGRFVCMSVTDTGSGMSQTVLKRIFEPFFTTKEAGKGTGLGLATVHGIVAQHKGWVDVASEVEQGTTFQVFLPVISTPVSATAIVPKAKPLRQGSETILVVEDNPAVLQMTVQSLRKLGYTVFETENGPEALTAWQKHGAAIDLVLTDMVMPEGMTGLELVERFQAARPGLKVIIASGYSAEIAQAGVPTRAGIVYLPKPYDTEVLASAVRDCLDAKNTG